ncbi:SAM-dependent methyltransferase [Kutzneria viridogrisea]|uniref:S-adenosyl methyltransferase n=1 Tax=Kutzneria viridogrisea TaxID=47990 RepID=A0ABR6BPX4_9PSEU|nr:hypothetical protein [Kutzneria viridogrisea]
MTDQAAWVPPEVDPSIPSIARAYDYMLGGAHNFTADRQLAEQAEKAVPGSRQIARLNRSFLARAVRVLVESGVRQFLDIGSGVPTVGNVHEIAQRSAPESRVLYVDKDPIAVAHSQLILAGNENADVLREDLRNPEAILESKQAKRLLDLDEPVAVLMVMMLHWVPEQDDPYGLVGRYRDAICPGSYLAISHVTADQRQDQISEAADVIQRAKSPDQLAYRTHAQVVRLFEGMELLDPGVVGCGLWRTGGSGDFADEPDLNSHVYAGVARKP